MHVSHSNCVLESITACKVSLKNTSDLKVGEIKALLEIHCIGNANSHAPEHFLDATQIQWPFTS